MSTVTCWPLTVIPAAWETVLPLMLKNELALPFQVGTSDELSGAGVRSDTSKASGSVPAGASSAQPTTSNEMESGLGGTTNVWDRLLSRVSLSWNCA